MITYTDKRGVSWNADRQQLCSKENNTMHHIVVKQLEYYHSTLLYH